MGEQDGRSMCRVCRGPLEHKKTGRPRLYCGDACRSTAYRRRQGQQSRAYHQAQREQKRLEALPLTERVMDMEKDEPVYTFSDGRRLYRCLACGKLYEAKRRYRQHYRRFCSDPCEKKAKYHSARLDDAYEALHQQHARASWPSWRASHNGKPRQHRYADCPVCGERFDRTDSVGRRSRKYCSEQCNRRMKNERKKLRAKGLLPPAQHLGRPIQKRVHRRRQAEREPLMKGWKRVGGLVTYVGQ